MVSLVSTSGQFGGAKGGVANTDGLRAPSENVQDLVAAEWSNSADCCGMKWKCKRTE